ncbi:hypothetical protein M758_9G121600 [Ceratodon purpureus]|uniref:Uncharacterized protein n=1 Tax=Ceratodon purpureus TaxID=3225 RepID=A0A8T0GQQ7_CERPU|nr:hypothetical protein KC19_9G106200 [Ceratodon purpureus]KAG0606198.1 hypothetical protein M758_9G121600 [Ceratodon purpureus]
MMDAQHAMKGRQKLEDLRRKKAAALSGNGAQVELEAMTIRLQNVEEKLQQVESERDLLRRQKEETAVKAGSLQDDLDRARGQVSQDEKTVAMLRKSLDTITMERDAAFISREDMVAQLRLMKRRLQEAEEEQYKAEEDAAALRAEIKLLQASEDQSESLGATAEQLRLAEQHNNTLQKELQEVALRLQQEQQRVSMERQRSASLNAQNQDLQNELLTMSAKLAEMEEPKQSRTSVTAPFSEAALADSATSKDGLASEEKLLSDEKAKVEKALIEKKLRELANMVERQENGRQTLLAEIDKQSLEIERLFVENEGLRLSVQQTTEIAARWEAQVQDCIEQNNELRTMLNQLRLEQSSVTAPTDAEPSDLVDPHAGDGSPGYKAALDSWKAERTKLKIELAKALARSEEMNSQLAQQSADMNRAVQAYTSLSNLYKPVLSSIENRLMQIRQDTPDVVFAGM